MRRPNPLFQFALPLVLLALAAAFLVAGCRGFEGGSAPDVAALGAGLFWLLAAGLAAWPLLVYVRQRRRFRVALASG